MPMRGDHSPLILMAEAPSASRRFCSSYRMPTLSVRLRKTFHESCAKTARFFVVGGFVTPCASWKPEHVAASAADVGAPKLPVWRTPFVVVLRLTVQGNGREVPVVLVGEVALGRVALEMREPPGYFSENVEPSFSYSPPILISWPPKKKEPVAL